MQPSSLFGASSLGAISEGGVEDGFEDEFKPAASFDFAKQAASQPAPAAARRQSVAALKGKGIGQRINMFEVIGKKKTAADENARATAHNFIPAFRSEADKGGQPSSSVQEDPGQHPPHDGSSTATDAATAAPSTHKLAMGAASAGIVLDEADDVDSDASTVASDSDGEEEQPASQQQEEAMAGGAPTVPEPEAPVAAGSAPVAAVAAVQEPAVEAVGPSGAAALVAAGQLSTFSTFAGAAEEGQHTWGQQQQEAQEDTAEPMMMSPTPVYIPCHAAAANYNGGQQQKEARPEQQQDEPASPVQLPGSTDFEPAAMSETPLAATASDAGPVPMSVSPWVPRQTPARVAEPLPMAPLPESPAVPPPAEAAQEEEAPAAAAASPMPAAVVAASPAPVGTAVLAAAVAASPAPAVAACTSEWNSEEHQRLEEEAPAAATEPVYDVPTAAPSAWEHEPTADSEGVAAQEEEAPADASAQAAADLAQPPAAATATEGEVGPAASPAAAAPAAAGEELALAADAAPSPALEEECSPVAHVEPDAPLPEAPAEGVAALSSPATAAASPASAMLPAIAAAALTVMAPVAKIPESTHDSAPHCEPPASPVGTAPAAFAEPEEEAQEEEKRSEEEEELGAEQVEEVAVETDVEAGALEVQQPDEQQQFAAEQAKVHAAAAEAPAPAEVDPAAAAVLEEAPIEPAAGCEEEAPAPAEADSAAKAVLDEATIESAAGCEGEAPPAAQEQQPAAGGAEACSAAVVESAGQQQQEEEVATEASSKGPAAQQAVTSRQPEQPLQVEMVGQQQEEVATEASSTGPAAQQGPASSQRKQLLQVEVAGLQLEAQEEEEECGQFGSPIHVDGVAVSAPEAVAGEQELRDATPLKAVPEAVQECPELGAMAAPVAAATAPEGPTFEEEEAACVAEVAAEAAVEAAAAPALTAIASADSAELSDAVPEADDMQRLAQELDKGSTFLSTPKARAQQRQGVPSGQGGEDDGGEEQEEEEAPGSYWDSLLATNQSPVGSTKHSGFKTAAGSARRQSGMRPRDPPSTEPRSTKRQKGVLEGTAADATPAAHHLRSAAKHGAAASSSATTPATTTRAGKHTPTAARAGGKAAGAAAAGQGHLTPGRVLSVSELRASANGSAAKPSAARAAVPASTAKAPAPQATPAAARRPGSALKGGRPPATPATALVKQQHAPACTPAAQQQPASKAPPTSTPAATPAATASVRPLQALRPPHLSVSPTGTQARTGIAKAWGGGAESAPGGLDSDGASGDWLQKSIEFEGLPAAAGTPSEVRSRAQQEGLPRFGGGVGEDGEHQQRGEASASGAKEEEEEGGKQLSVEQLQERNAQLAKDNAALQASAAEAALSHDALFRELRQYKAMCDKQRDRHNDVEVKLRSQVSLLQEQLGSLRGEKENAESVYSTMYTAKYKPLKEQAADLNQQLAKVRNDKTVGELQLRKARVEVADLKAKLGAAEQQLAAAQAEVASLRSQLDEAGSAGQEAKQLQARARQLAEELEEANMRLSAQQKHRERMLSEALAKDDKLAEADAKLADAQRRLKDYSAENSKFFGVQEKYKQRIAKLEREVADKETEREQLLRMCDEMMTKLESSGVAM